MHNVETLSCLCYKLTLSVNHFEDMSDARKSAICNFHGTIYHSYFRQDFQMLLAITVANSVDPDQTAPVGAVRSGSALFTQRPRPVSTLRTESHIATLMQMNLISQNLKITPFTQLLQTRVCFTNAGINNNNI